MTKPSAVLTAAAMVVALMAGVAARDLSHTAPPPSSQIVVQIVPGASTVPGTVPTLAPTQPAEGG